MAKAILEGRLSFDAYSNAVKDAGASIGNTFEETLDPLDEVKTAMNELKIVGMELVQAAAPFIKQLVDTLKTAFSNLRKWWEGLSPIAQQTIIMAAAIAAALGPVLVIVGKVIGLIGTIMGLGPQIVNIIGVVKGALSGLWAVLSANPIALVVAAIAALVAGFVYLWDTSEDFRNFWIGLWESIKQIAQNVGKALSDTWKNVSDKAVELWTGLKDRVIGIWDGIKSKAKSIWDGITGTIKGAIDKIRNFFNFKWEFPKLKLPHFSITGKFSLNPPQVPHLSVEWYKKAMQDGMILSRPTVLPSADGKMRGFGDGGPEAVVGVSSLRSMINSAVNAAMPKGGAAKNLTVILQMDGSEFARTTLPYLDAEEQRVGVKLATV